MLVHKPLAVQLGRDQTFKKACIHTNFSSGLRCLASQLFIQKTPYELELLANSGVEDRNNCSIEGGISQKTDKKITGSGVSCNYSLSV